MKQDSGPRCDDCGYLNDPGASFCSRCGDILTTKTGEQLGEEGMEKALSKDDGAGTLFKDACVRQFADDVLSNARWMRPFYVDDLTGGRILTKFLVVHPELGQAPSKNCRGPTVKALIAKKLLINTWDMRKSKRKAQKGHRYATYLINRNYTEK